MDLVHGSEKNFLVTSKLDFGEVRGVTLTWTKSSSVLNPLNWFRGNEIHVESLSLNPMYQSSKRVHRNSCSKTKRLLLLNRELDHIWYEINVDNNINKSHGVLILYINLRFF